MWKYIQVNESARSDPGDESFTKRDKQRLCETHIKRWTWECIKIRLNYQHPLYSFNFLASPLAASAHTLLQIETQLSTLSGRSATNIATDAMMPLLVISWLECDYNFIPFKMFFIQVPCFLRTRLKFESLSWQKFRKCILAFWQI